MMEKKPIRPLQELRSNAGLLLLCGWLLSSWSCGFDASSLEACLSDPGCLPSGDAGEQETEVAIAACGVRASCDAEEACCRGSAECSLGGTDCGCIRVQDDDANCGQCGLGCSPAHRCVGGECVCKNALEADCNGVCVLLETNGEHCGRCGNACAGLESCVGGQCDCGGLVCDDWACCGVGPSRSPGCTDTLESPVHCGGCAASCNPGEWCSNGRCRCGETEACAAGLSCCDGACVAGPCVCGGSSCAQGLGCCFDQCADLRTDPNHCGVCARQCPVGTSCIDGICSCEPENPNRCDGQCVDRASDESHCGECDHQCAELDQCCDGACTATLSSTAHCGSCGTTCALGWLCCDGVCVNAPGDVAHCGGCEQQCLPTQHCDQGTCTCEPFTLCAEVCVSLLDDEQHCGTCDQGCTGNSVCCAGECVSLDSDPAHCGTCGDACAEDNACVGGYCRCTESSCSGGRICCNELCVDPLSDLNYCGNCSTVCDPARQFCDGACRPLVPNNPTDVNATDYRWQSSVISFTMPAWPVSSCQLYRSLEPWPLRQGAGVTELQTFPAMETPGVVSFTDTNLDDTKVYYYTVFCEFDGAFNDTLDSGNRDSALPDAPWWNCSYRRRVRVDGITPQNVPNNYSLSVLLDHAALVNNSRSLSSGNDVRVVFFDYASNTQKDRRADPWRSWNRSDTRVWFPNDARPGIFYLYYNNTSPNTPLQNLDMVFPFADYFERNDNNNVGNGWTMVEGDGDIDINGWRLFFNDCNNLTNRPYVERGFPAQTEKLSVRYGLNWRRSGNEGTYRLHLQLGKSGDMNTPPTNNDNVPNTGIGPSLVWTGTTPYLQDYRGGDSAYLFAVNDFRDVELVADLATDKYQVRSNAGSFSGWKDFANNLDRLDKLRLMTWELEEGNFDRRYFNYVIVRKLIDNEPQLSLREELGLPQPCP